MRMVDIARFISTGAAVILPIHNTDSFRTIHDVRWQYCKPARAIAHVDVHPTTYLLVRKVGWDIARWVCMVWGGWKVRRLGSNCVHATVCGAWWHRIAVCKVWGCMYGGMVRVLWTF